MPSISEWGRSVSFGCLVAITACHSDGEGLHPRPIGGSGGEGPAGAPPNIPGVPGVSNPYTPPDGAVLPDGAAPPAPLDALPIDATPVDSSIPAVVTPPDNLPPAGNAAGKCVVPPEAMPEDVSRPTTVVGTGTPASCTSAAFVDAVAAGGIITFDCGPAPVTITLDRTAKIFNDKGPKIVIDGGGKVTLSGGGKVRILYMNTCDKAQVWTTDHCDNQDHPQLTVQNLTFVDATSKGLDPEGGAAIYAIGGRVKVVNSRFFRNRCSELGSTIGGGALHAWAQFNKLPVHVVNSTFGGAPDLGNACSNGGAINGLAVSLSIYNSVFTGNSAIGKGLRAAPGGGSGGAVYDDAGTLALSICGSSFAGNTANEKGGAIYFDSGPGSMTIMDSTVSANKAMGPETKDLPGIFVTTQRSPSISNSKIE
jgi:hypothetical protein